MRLRENEGSETLVGHKVRWFLRRLNDTLSRPSIAAVLSSDSILVTTPEKNAQWYVGSTALVKWRVVGVAAHPLDVVLVRLKDGTVENVALLAQQIGVHDLAVRVTVPDVPDSSDYTVALISPDPTEVRSRKFAITHRHTD